MRGHRSAHVRRCELLVLVQDFGIAEKQPHGCARLVERFSDYIVEIGNKGRDQRPADPPVDDVGPGMADRGSDHPVRCQRGLPGAQRGVMTILLIGGDTASDEHQHGVVIVDHARGMATGHRRHPGGGDREPGQGAQVHRHVERHVLLRVHLQLQDVAAEQLAKGFRALAVGERPAGDVDVVEFVSAGQSRPPGS